MFVKRRTWWSGWWLRIVFVLYCMLSIMCVLIDSTPRVCMHFFSDESIGKRLLQKRENIYIYFFFEIKCKNYNFLLVIIIWKNDRWGNIFSLFAFFFSLSSFFERCWLQKRRRQQHWRSSAATKKTTRAKRELTRKSVENKKVTLCFAFATKLCILTCCLVVMIKRSNNIFFSLESYVDKCLTRNSF